MNSIVLIIKKSFGQYKQFIFSKQNVLIIYAIAIIYEDIVVKMKEAASLADCTLNTYEPFVLLTTSIRHCLILPIVMVVIVSSDFLEQGNKMFEIYRIGKLKKLVSDIVLVFLICLTFFAGIVIVSSLAISAGKANTNSWSDFTCNLYVLSPETYHQYEQLFLADSVVTQGTLREVVAYSMVSWMLYLTLIYQGYTVFRLKNLKNAGIAFITGLTAINWIIVKMDFKIKWVFPLCHALYGEHFNSFYLKENFSLWWSLLYLIVANVVLFFVSVSCSKKYLYW